MQNTARNNFEIEKSTNSDVESLKNSPAIVCENVSKSYKLYPDRAARVKEAIHPLRKKMHTEFHAVNNVSFTIQKGETFGIIGKNGSGKSTLLQLICGILQPSSGRVSVEGRISALLELGAGFNAEFTGIENVYLNGSILGLSKEEIDNKLDRILSFADIGDFVYQPVKTYSSGMYVRLAFSVMANIDPEVFVVDEALAVGDAHFVHRCMHRFRELQDAGTTILFVSHDTSSIKRLCKRALWLHEGKTQGVGDSRDIADAYLEHLFGISGHADRTDGNVTTDKDSTPEENASSINSAFPPRETNLPNVDKRSGSGEIICIGANLYNEAGKAILETEQDSKVIFRLSIKNIANTRKLPWAIGYILRDFKGIEIASTHTLLEQTTLPDIAPGETTTIQFIIAIPSLYPGSYSLSSSISLLENGEHKITDRIMNMIVFKISSDKEMHVLMRLPTEVIIEP
jgi:lipopolysaccharide transport system ATP-binding protein